MNKYLIKSKTLKLKDALAAMQTRKELYGTISYFKFEELDRELAKTILEKE